MSHGGAESGRSQEKSQVPKRKSGSGGDEFAQSIAKIAVAQICESAGFQTFQQSALETLSDITVRYIHIIGKFARDNANLAGRTEGNAVDIIQALEELGSSQGFAGASDIDHCFMSSGTVRELARYVREAEDVPFAYSIPPFPVIREKKPVQSFSQIGVEPPGEHIPDWLPAFPDPQTYLPLPIANEGAVDFNMQKMGLTKPNPMTGRTSLNLQQLGSRGPSSAALAGGLEAKSVVEGNPYLAAPLQFGEKEVSRIIPPTKLSDVTAVRDPVKQDCLPNNHVSVLDTFAPTIEAMKGRLCDSEEGKKKVPLNQRPTVQFKIGIGKKSLGTAVELRSQNKGFEKISSRSGKDTETDDKKRRAENILKQSIENPGELAQL